MPEQRMDAQGERGIIHVDSRWIGIDDPSTPVIYSNAVLTQFTPHEFIINFARYTPPDTTAMSDGEVGAIEAVPAYVQVKVILSPGRMGEFVGSVVRSWNQFMVAQGVSPEQDDDDEIDENEG